MSNTRPLMHSAGRRCLDARYSGVKLSENSLIPGKDAKLGSTKFDWWLENVAPPPKK